MAGIRPDPAVPGFRNIIIQPAIVGDVTWAKAHYDSPYGRIISQWKREGNMLMMDVTIPANTTATVIIPGKGGGTRKVGSGVYRFKSEMD